MQFLLHIKKNKRIYKKDGAVKVILVFAQVTFLSHIIINKRFINMKMKIVEFFLYKTKYLYKFRCILNQMFIYIQYLYYNFLYFNFQGHFFVCIFIHVSNKLFPSFRKTYQLRQIYDQVEVPTSQYKMPGYSVCEAKLNSTRQFV